LPVSLQFNIDARVKKHEHFLYHAEITAFYYVTNLMLLVRKIGTMFERPAYLIAMLSLVSD